jgi:hypothetical protein
MVLTNKNKNKNKNKKKTRKYKRKTYKRKTYKKKKYTHGQLGGVLEVCKYGKKCYQTNVRHTQKYSHPCREGRNCTNINPSHSERFTHPINNDIKLYENDAEIKKALDDSYTLFTQDVNNWRDMNGNFDMSSLRVMYYNTLNPRELMLIKTTFYFHLLTYIVCNLCELLDEYTSPTFLTRLMLMFDEEAVTGIFPINESDILLCLDNVGITEPVISNTHIRDTIIINREKICNKI